MVNISTDTFDITNNDVNLFQDEAQIKKEKPSVDPDGFFQYLYESVSCLFHSDN